RRIVLDGDEVIRDAGEPLDVTRLLALRIEPREVAAKIELLDALAVDHGRSHAGAHRIDVVAAVVLVDHFPEQQVTERRLRLEPDRLMPASERMREGRLLRPVRLPVAEREVRESPAD